MREQILGTYKRGMLAERRRETVISLARTGNAAREERRRSAAFALAQDGVGQVSVDGTSARVPAEGISASLAPIEVPRTGAGQPRAPGGSITGSVRSISEVEAGEIEELRTARRQRFE